MKLKLAINILSEHNYAKDKTFGPPPLNDTTNLKKVLLRIIMPQQKTYNCRPKMFRPSKDN